MSIVEQEQAWCATTPKRIQVAEPHGSSLKSVGSALDVLECFALDGELGVSDIARRLGGTKSTAHRLLHTLVSRGFVEQDVPSSARYRLGFHIYELGALALARNELRHSALRTLRRSPPRRASPSTSPSQTAPNIVFVKRVENRDSGPILGHAAGGCPSPAPDEQWQGDAPRANSSTGLARRRAGFPPPGQPHGAHPDRLASLHVGVRARGC